MSEKRKKIKKVFSVIVTVFSVIIFAVAAFVLVNVVISKVRKQPVNFFGYSFASVLTPSMSPTINVGDLIVYRLCDISEVEPEDIIVFVAGDAFGAIKGNNVVHRARAILADGSIQTKGDANDSNDPVNVTAQNFIGICVSSAAGLGEFFTFILNYGVIILIAVVAVPFIIMQAIKIVKLAKYGDGADKDGEDKE